jgi:hypothetical protein
MINFGASNLRPCWGSLGNERTVMILGNDDKASSLERVFLIFSFSGICFNTFSKKYKSEETVGEITHMSPLVFYQKILWRLLLPILCFYRFGVVLSKQ